MLDLQLLEEIERAKLEHDVYIIAHCYQSYEVRRVADFCGDVVAMLRHIREVDAQTILVCGVRYMAEMVKLAAPHKRVMLANMRAICPLENHVDVRRLRMFKEENPGVKVAVCLNTTAQIKAEADIVVLSSNAAERCGELECSRILLMPDTNLGRYVQQKLPDKEIVIFPSRCPVYSAVSCEDIELVQTLHPQAKVAVHLGCSSEVVERADFAGSAGDIIKFCASVEDDVIIAAESSLPTYLKELYPDREFYAVVAEKMNCPAMRMTSLSEILRAINLKQEIIIDAHTAQRAEEKIAELLSYSQRNLQQ